MSKLSPILLILIIGVMISNVSAVSYPYYEGFTSTTYMDAESTTADWGSNVNGVATPGLGPRMIQFTEAGGSRANAVTEAVATNGRYVFCAASNVGAAGGGLYVFDGEDYSQVGSYVNNENEGGVAVSSEYAYLVDDDGEIEEVDIGDLSTMTGGTYSVGAGVNLVDAAYANGYLYVAAGNNGFYSVKVADGIGSATHTSNSTYAGGSADARGVAIWGRYLLVADDNGLYVFSLANPVTPEASGNITSIGDCYDIDTDGYYAYVASGNRINIIDLADPSSPSLEAWKPSLGTCTAIAFNSGYTVGCNGVDGVKVFNFRNYVNYKYNGKIVFSQPGASAVDAVTIGKQTVVATGDAGGVVFLSNAHVFSPAVDWEDEISLASYGTGEAADVIVNGRYAYASVQTYGLVTIDLTTMAVTNTDALASSNALGMALEGDILLIAGGADGLYFFDVTSPENPAIDGAVVSIGGGVVYDVTSDGKYAYLGMGGAFKGIARVDLFTKAYSRISTSFDVFSVDLSGNILVAACRDSGLGVIDITEFDEASPTINYYTHTSGRCWGGFVDNDYAYVAYGDGGLRIVDVSDPSSPSAVGGLDRADVGIILGVCRLDSLIVLVRDETEPLVFVDITSPASPSVVSTSLLPVGTTLPEAIIQWRDYIMIADFFGGIKTWEIYTQKNTLKNSQLMSTEINQDGSRAIVNDLKYFMWKSYEYFPHSSREGETDDGDTVTFWMAFDDGTDYDEIKIFHDGVAGTTEYKYPQPLPWGGDTAWEYIGYLPNSVNDLRWKGIIQEGHEGWTLDGTWHACSILVRFTTDDPPAARRRVSTRIDVDFGGEIIELEIGLDSAATDRYDPAFDELYYPTGPGPHAYFSIDDPDMPEGAGLSSCWVSTKSVGRPIRLVLSDPAILSWTAPPELDPGVLVINDVDMAEESSVSLSDGQHRVIPGAGAAVYFKTHLDRGWNLVAPMAYPLANSIVDVFGVPIDNIWSYNDALGGYYNPTTPADGQGYFILSTSEIDQSFYGVIDEWTRTLLHPGWNLIGGPTNGPVHVSDLVTEPDSLVWPGPFYTYADGDYEVTEWLRPGVGHWVYSTGAGVLYAESDDMLDKQLLLAKPDHSTIVSLSSGSNLTTLTLGVDSRSDEVIFDRLLVPPMPGKRNIGGLISAGAPTYLSTSVMQGRLAEWDLMIFENCRISSDSNLRLIRDGEEFFVDIDGLDITAGRYKVLLESAPIPRDFLLAVSPNPFNSVTKITTYIPRSGNLNVSVYDLNGRKVSRIIDGEVSSGRHTYCWNALSFEGKALPSGIYFAKLSLDGNVVLAKKLVLLK